MKLLQEAIEKESNHLHLAEIAANRYSTDMMVKKYIELYREMVMA